MVLVLRPQRRRAHPLGTLETGLRELILERQVEVLRTRLGEHVLAVVPRRGNLLERLRGRHVHDVERNVPRHLGELDGPVGRLPLELGGTGERVEPGIGLAPRQRLADEHVDRDAVLGVHHHDRAALAGILHRPQDLAVVGVEDAGVRHEQLEAGDALVVDEVRHRLQRLLVDAADDLVEAVVDRAVPVGLVVPLGEPVHHVLAGALHGEVDDGGDAAPRRGDRAGLERVGRGGATERELHVGVHVDAAGDHVLAGGVDLAVRERCRSPRPARGRARRRSSRRR